MATDNDYSKVLLELKTKYELTLTELEAHTNQIKARLTSLDTLIDDPLLGTDILSILQGEADSLASEVPISDSNVSNTVKPKAKAKPRKTAAKTSSSSRKRKSLTSKQLASTPKDTKKVEPKAESKSKGATPKTSSSSAKKKPSTSKKAASQDKAKKTKRQAGRSSSRSLKMNKPYDKMNKIDAIAKILQENPGKVMHTDDLSFILFGELTPEQHKAERARMKTTMYRGVEQNRWLKVPKKQMCYVFESSKNVGPIKSGTPKVQKSQKKT